MTEPVDILWAYADHLGIARRPLEKDGPAWDGHALQAFTRAEDLSHEVAHWIIATPDQRALVNFGWNYDWQWTGWDDGDGPAEFNAAGRDESNDEFLACCLGFSLLVRSCYLDVTEVYRLYGFYDWHITDIDSRERLDPSTYGLRRTVQPHVAAFEAWKADRP